VVIAIIGILASMMLPALARAKAKANRMKCSNNVTNVYKAGLSFSQNNGERLPWQCDTLGVREHFQGNALSTAGYGNRVVPSGGIVAATPNLLKAHGHSQAAAACYALKAMKVELVTPATLRSPCDSARSAANNLANDMWKFCDTKSYGLTKTCSADGSGSANLNGTYLQLSDGCSYVLCRGADAQRPTSVYSLTRNGSAPGGAAGAYKSINSYVDGLTAMEGSIGPAYTGAAPAAEALDRLDIANWKWVGADDLDPAHSRIMSGMTESQGQFVLMDGSAKQSISADFGDLGPQTKNALNAAGGLCPGPTSMMVIRGLGMR